jgi:hypothetical protein
VRVWHYLYFDDEQTAKLVAQRLENANYRTEVRQSEPSWLLRAEHSIPESEEDVLEATAESLTSLAAAEGGEYDGWERETHSASRNQPPND